MSAAGTLLSPSISVLEVLSHRQIAVSPFLLESPRWLLGRDEQSTEARVVIKKLRGFRNDEDVEVTLS